MEEAGQTLVVRRGYRPKPVVLESAGGRLAALKFVETGLNDAGRLLHRILPGVGRREVVHRILGYRHLHREAQAVLRGMVVLGPQRVAAKMVGECQLIEPDDVCMHHLQRDRQGRGQQEQGLHPAQVYEADRSLHHGQISSGCYCRNALGEDNSRLHRY